MNWMRRHDPPIERAIALASDVLPTPGTSSMSRWPSANRHTSARCTARRLPRRTCSTWSGERVEGVLERRVRTGSDAAPDDLRAAGSAHCGAVERQRYRPAVVQPRQRRATACDVAARGFGAGPVSVVVSCARPVAVVDRAAPVVRACVPRAWWRQRAVPPGADRVRYLRFRLETAYGTGPQARPTSSRTASAICVEYLEWCRRPMRVAEARVPDLGTLCRPTRR